MGDGSCCYHGHCYGKWRGNHLPFSFSPCFQTFFSSNFWCVCVCVCFIVFLLDFENFSCKAKFFCLFYDFSSTVHPLANTLLLFKKLYFCSTIHVEMLKHPLRNSNLARKLKIIYLL